MQISTLPFAVTVLISTVISIQIDQLWFLFLFALFFFFFFFLLFFFFPPLNHSERTISGYLPSFPPRHHHHHRHQQQQQHPHHRLPAPGPE